MFGVPAIYNTKVERWLCLGGIQITDITTKITDTGYYSGEGEEKDVILISIK